MKKHILAGILALLSHEAFASYAFDGTNDTLTLGSAPLTAVSLTITAWLKLPVTIGNDAVIVLGAGSSTDNQFQLRVGSTGALQCSVIQGSTGTAVDSSSPVTDQNWHFAICRFTSATSREARWDNTSGGTNATSLTPTGVNQFKAGENNNGAEDYEGSIAHIALWNRSLSSADEAALAAGRNPMAADGGAPTRYWPLTGDNVDLISGATLTVAGATLQSGVNPTVDSPVPTFTAGPTLGTVTTTTLPTTFTVDQTGNVYGVACPDGQTPPTIAQTKAGNCTGNIAAAAAFTEPVVLDVSDGHTFTGLSSNTIYDLSFVANSLGGDSTLATIANATTASAAPTFTAGPGIGTITTTTIPVTYTASDAVSTMYVGACKKDTTPPTGVQLKAGHCTGDVTAEAAANEATTGSSDSITLTGLGTLPVYDVYALLSNSSSDTAVQLLADKCMVAVAGKQNSLCAGGFTSIAGGSLIAGFNLSVTPDIATGDIPVCDATLSPGGFAWTVGADGNFSYTGDLTREIGLCTFYDVSAFGNHADTLKAVFNDPGIACNPDYTVVIPVGSAMTTFNINSNCTHTLGDVLSFATTTGTLPTGISLNGSSGDISGTATVENESGATVIITATSTVSGVTATQTITFYPIDTITMPDCQTSHLSVGSCIDSLQLKFLDAAILTPACSMTVAAGLVISQSVAPATEVAAFSTTDLIYSRGKCRRGLINSNF